MSSYSYYEKQLDFLIVHNYEICSFNSFLSNQLNESTSRSAVLRFDIHARDISNAKMMYGIEKKKLGKCMSTSFVMWRLLADSEAELNFELNQQKNYEEYIRFCIDSDIDVQPHISPINEYIYRYQPWWQKASISELSNIVSTQYVFDLSAGGISIEPKDKDILQLSHLNDKLPEILEEYNAVWYFRFQQKVQGYAVHGNHIPLNRVMHNGVLLNQTFMKELGLFGYEVYSSEIREKLALYSDCASPLWMYEPEEINHAQIQLLRHPAKWADSQMFAVKNKADQKQIDSKRYLYPYLAPLDFIVNPGDFFNSRLEANEYCALRNTCH